jgi:hypothetical protein
LFISHSILRSFARAAAAPGRRNAASIEHAGFALTSNAAKKPVVASRCERYYGLCSCTQGRALPNLPAVR